ncbi:MAG: GlsB/YeaQ/YmgE family stress response membrane protein [Asticcacaulis sp.]
MLIVGLIAGWLAHMIMGGRGSLIGNLVVGLIGSIVGGFLASAFGIGFYGLVGSIIISTIGAIVLLAIFHAVTRSRTV